MVKETIKEERNGTIAAEKKRHAALWWAFGVLAVLLLAAIGLLAWLLIRQFPIGAVSLNNLANNQAANAPVDNQVSNTTPTAENVPPIDLAALPPTRPLYGTYDFAGGFGGGSGSGDFTAFASEEQLFKSDFGGGNTFSTLGRVSPNGRFLAVTVFGANPELFVMDVDGRNQRKVTAELAYSGDQIVWSADSAALFFRTFNEETQKEVLNSYDLATREASKYDRPNEQSYSLVSADEDELFAQIYNDRHAPDSTSLHAIPIGTEHSLRGEAPAVLIDHAEPRFLSVSPNGRYVASVRSTNCPDLPPEDFCTGLPTLLDLLDRKSGARTTLRTFDNEVIGSLAFTADSTEVVYSFSAWEVGPAGLATIGVDGSGVRTILSGQPAADEASPYFAILGVSIEDQIAVSYYSASRSTQYPRLALVPFGQSNLTPQSLEYLGTASKPVEFFGWTQ